MASKSIFRKSFAKLSLSLLLVFSMLLSLTAVNVLAVERHTIQFYFIISANFMHKDGSSYQAPPLDIKLAIYEDETELIVLELHRSTEMIEERGVTYIGSYDYTTINPGRYYAQFLYIEDYSMDIAVVQHLRELSPEVMSNYHVDYYNVDTQKIPLDLPLYSYSTPNGREQRFNGYWKLYLTYEIPEVAPSLPEPLPSEEPEPEVEPEPITQPDIEPSSDDIKILIDGKKLQSDVLPIIIDNRTFVPFRAIAEALGAEVDWNDSDRAVTITKDDKTAILVIDNKNVVIKTSDEQSAIELDVAPTIIDNRTLGPVRFISEFFGYDVNWDDNTKTVTISIN
jgi:hypothetical protein